jgi:hypothetical protein
MLVVGRIVVGIVGVFFVMGVAACQPATVYETPPEPGSQPPVTASEPRTSPPAEGVVWGRVPYCSCLADSATANVATALQEAHLVASLQELSPYDGWLYFVVRFDPHSATGEQVGVALMAGGAEVVEGPP